MNKPITLWLRHLPPHNPEGHHNHYSDGHTKDDAPTPPCGQNWKGARWTKYFAYLTEAPQKVVYYTGEENA